MKTFSDFLSKFLWRFRLQDPESMKVKATFGRQGRHSDGHFKGHCQRNYLYLKIQPRTKLWLPCLPWRPWKQQIIEESKLFAFTIYSLKVNCFARFFTLSFLRQHFTLWQVYTKVRSWQKVLHQFSNLFLEHFSFFLPSSQKKVGG